MYSSSHSHRVDRYGSQRSRAQGALVGLAVGDAVGTTLEFQSRPAEPAVTDMVGGGPFGLKAGEWTDDTSMALCLADSLIETASGLDQRNLMEHFVGWYQNGINSTTGECFDIGGTTATALMRFMRDGVVVAGSTQEDTAGNGGIMRLAPVAIRWFDDPLKSSAHAVNQSVVTHAAPQCCQAARMLGLILSRLISGWPFAKALLDLHSSPHVDLANVVTGRFANKEIDEVRSGGYVAETLEAALWSVATTTSFEEAILKAANLGGDADTTAAVAGQIAGARYGIEGIPQHWRERVYWCEDILGRADRLLDIRYEEVGMYNDLRHSPPEVSGLYDFVVSEEFTIAFADCLDNEPAAATDGSWSRFLERLLFIENGKPYDRFYNCREHEWLQVERIKKSGLMALLTEFQWWDRGFRWTGEPHQSHEATRAWLTRVTALIPTNQS